MTRFDVDPRPQCSDFVRSRGLQRFVGEASNLVARGTATPHGMANRTDHGQRVIGAKVDSELWIARGHIGDAHARFRAGFSFASTV